ncbi:MAG: hypothetical protein RL030_2765 [Pseudomonadota bacterium]|jgi:hypothetical protein
MNPIYHCPPGVALPAHAKQLAPIGLVDGAGPGGLGGTMYGGPYHADDAALYVPSPDGWSVCLEGTTQRDLLRREAIAGQVVDGWTVPLLMNGEISTIGYWTASGFQVPAKLAPLIDALRLSLDDVPGEACRSERWAHLAAALIAVNYHTSIVELGAKQVLTPRFIANAVCAAAGVAVGG